MFAQVRCLRGFVLGTTAIVLTMTASVAVAQDSNTSAAAGNASPPVESVVVTGTHIHGVAAVGSATISLGEQDILTTGATDANDLLQKVPELTNIGNSSTTNFGGSRPQAAGGNTALQDTINLRGVSTDATLVLFNGQRVSGGGSGGVVDPDSFSPDMIQRVDVQADGGSAIYGSDAIAGTVNFILREPTDITRFYGQTLFKRGDTGWVAGALVGRTWSLGDVGDGGIIINYQHTYSAPTPSQDLSYAFNDNLVPYEGAAGAQSTSAVPGNLSGFSNAPTTLYPVPPTGIAAGGQLNLGQLGTAGVPNRTTLYTDTLMVVPQIRRDAVAFNFKQDLFFPWLHMFAFGDYNRRAGIASYGSTPQPLAALSIPNTNPYSPCATAAAAASAGLPAPNTTNSQGIACPASGTLSMAYNLVNEYGGSETRQFNEKTFMETAGFDVDLPWDWKGRLSESLSRVNTLTQVNNQVNTTALAQTISGVNKPSTVPFFNPFCSDQTGPCNSASTINYFRGHINNNAFNILADYNLGLDGPIFDLPAGTLRLAVGAEYADQSSLVTTTSEITAAIGENVPGNNAKGDRYFRALYAEGYVPIVSTEMGIPLVRKLEVTASVRYSDYSLPRLAATNTKYGFNYSPIDDIQIHGSYGTSFRAPTVGQSLPGSSASILQGNVITPCSAYNGITCPSPTTSLTGVFFNGGNPGLQPQKGKTWSIGADLDPEFIPGMHLSGTYYHLLYSNLISQPGAPSSVPAIVNAGYLDSLIIFNPTYFPTRAVVNKGVLAVLPGLTAGAPLTQAQFNSVFPTLVGLQQYSTTQAPLAPTAVISDGLYQNSGFIDTDGIDFSGEYQFDAGFASAHVGATGTLVLDYDYQPVSGGPVLQEDNRFGYVTRFHGRLDAGLAKDGLSATLFMNYTNEYYSDPNFVPAAAVALNPNYLHISSNITWDLSLGWQPEEMFSEPLLHGTNLQVTFTNLLDKKPPFFLNAAITPAALYDSNEASPLGRTIAIRLSKDF